MFNCHEYYVDAISYFKFGKTWPCICGINPLTSSVRPIMFNDKPSFNADTCSFP